VDPENPDAIAGGKGFYLRWGGSWDGWKVKKDGTGLWRGEAIEAGYVTENRVYNNVFYGYDNGCITTPREDAMQKVLDPPPMNEANPARQYGKKFAFHDNSFVNNIVVPGPFEPHTNWSWGKEVAGKPVAVIMFGFLKEITFQRNDFYGARGGPGPLVYFREMAVGRSGKGFAVAPSNSVLTSTRTFVETLEEDPQFIDPAKNDFRLKKDSSLIDAGAFLTTTEGAESSSKIMKVKDVMSFFDGFGIEGEEGDFIQLNDEMERARIAHIDYAKRELTLDRPLSWNSDQKVALAYSGKAPDVGTFEQGEDFAVGPRSSPKSKPPNP
jgi:hypothetical protein